MRGQRQKCEGYFCLLAALVSCRLSPDVGSHRQSLDAGAFYAFLFARLLPRIRPALPRRRP